MRAGGRRVRGRGQMGEQGGRGDSAAWGHSFASPSSLPAVLATWRQGPLPLPYPNTTSPASQAASPVTMVTPMGPCTTSPVMQYSRKLR